LESDRSWTTGLFLLIPVPFEDVCVMCHDGKQRILGVLHMTKDFRPTQASSWPPSAENIIVSAASFVGRRAHADPAGAHHARPLSRWWA